MFIPHPTPLLFILALAGPAATAAPRLEACATPSRICALHRPAGWKVEEAASTASYSLQVAAPDGLARVRLLWARGGTRAVDLLRAARDREAGARLSDVFVTRDGARAVATLEFRAGGQSCRGRIFVETGDGRMSTQCYAAPVAQLDALRPVLMNVMMSVAFIKAPGGGAPPPPRWNLVERRAQDGSLRMKVPEAWNFLAAKGTVITGAPGGGAGFIFTSFAGNPALRGATIAQGVIGRTFEPPGRTLPLILTGFGHHEPRILSDAPDAASAAEYRASVGRPAQASDLVATWTSNGGVECLGAFKVINGLPVVFGQWRCLIAGIWGPRGDFGRHLPMLAQVADSFGLNDAYARRYIQDGLARLRRMEAETAASIRSLNYARADLQKAWEDRQARKDYMDSKWDDYRRGNSYWVSDLEGGKVYHADPSGTRDTVTGDYYEGGGYTYTHFEGRNPRHASETMREVSSYELEHGAPPR